MRLLILISRYVKVYSRTWNFTRGYMALEVRTANPRLTQRTGEFLFEWKKACVRDHVMKPYFVRFREIWFSAGPCSPDPTKIKIGFNEKFLRTLPPTSVSRTVTNKPSTTFIYLKQIIYDTPENCHQHTELFSPWQSYVINIVLSRANNRYWNKNLKYFLKFILKPKSLIPQSVTRFLDIAFLK